MARPAHGKRRESVVATSSNRTKPPASSLIRAPALPSVLKNHEPIRHRKRLDHLRGRCGRTPSRYRWVCMNRTVLLGDRPYGDFHDDSSSCIRVRFFGTRDVADCGSRRSAGGVDDYTAIVFSLLPVIGTLLGIVCGFLLKAAIISAVLRTTYGVGFLTLLLFTVFGALLCGAIGVGVMVVGGGVMLSGL